MASPLRGGLGRAEGRSVDCAEPKSEGHPPIGRPRSRSRRPLDQFNEGSRIPLRGKIDRELGTPLAPFPRAQGASLRDAKPDPRFLLPFAFGEAKPKGRRQRTLRAHGRQAEGRAEGLPIGGPVIKFFLFIIVVYH